MTILRHVDTLRRAIDDARRFPEDGAVAAVQRELVHRTLANVDDELGKLSRALSELLNARGPIH